MACAGGELVSLPAAGGAATRTLTLDRDLRDVVVDAGGSLLVSTFRKAGVLVVGASGGRHGAAAARVGAGAVDQGALQMRTPSVAWRMVPLDETMGSVVMLHQTGVTDMIDPAAGSYAGLKGCGGIVQPGVSVLAPGKPTPAVAGGLGYVSLAVDVAVSPDHLKVAFAVAGNTASQGPVGRRGEPAGHDDVAAVPVRRRRQRHHDTPSRRVRSSRWPTRRRASCSRRRASPRPSGVPIPA